MANRTNEIGDIVKKTKVLLLDIEGTTTSISFVKDKLFPYAEENVKKYLEAQWETDDVKEAVTGLRKLAAEDEENKIDGAVKIPAEDASKEDQIEGVVNNVKWLMSADRKVGPLKSLQGLIWKQGYDNGDIKGHVYDDVSPALEQWHAVDGQKIYIYSSGSVQAQKLLFGQSSDGDLLRFIDGHFDTAVGAKQEAASYTKIVGEIGCKPDEILFLTDILKEAEAATSAGLQAALLSREGNAPLPDDVTASYPVLHSFAQLAPSNKRKPDAQDESPQPAKVPKTETDLEVKPTSMEETSAKTTEVETEKMEVEEVNKTEETNASEETAAKVETVVEEITDSNGEVDASVITAAPIITEEKPDSEKSEEQSTAKMDTEEKIVEVEQTKNGAVETSAEIPSIVSTEIQEVTGEKTEAAELVDIQPLIEEPKSVENDTDDLQNVGEILEKECDEILSKVQDLTNLDNIPVKPLNSIPEETMETENTDTNDIVDGILDSELEMQMKESGDIAMSTATEVKEKSAENSAVAENGTTEDNCVKEEAPSTQTADKTEKATVQIESTSNGTEDKDSKDKVEESSAEPAKIEEKSSNDEVKSESTSTETEVTVSKEEVTEEKKDKLEEVKVNGTNGNTEALNGDSKDEELSSRLAAENCKDTNGANGDLNGVEDKKGEAEVSEIKVKTVAAAETHTDPIEQVTEA